MSLQQENEAFYPELDGPPEDAEPACNLAFATATPPVLPKGSNAPKSLPKQRRGGVQLKSVSDPHSRAPVPADKPPWRAICQVVAQGQGVNRGTGFAISPSWILTAAHVFDDIGVQQKIDLEFPGVNTIPAQRIVHPLYPAARAIDFDVALLRTPRDALAAVSGMIQLNAFDDAFLNAYVHAGAPAVVAGFPNDMPGLIAGSGPLVSITEGVIAHRVDTEAQESGAPLLYMTASQAFALGVHGRGAAPGQSPAVIPNRAARVRASILGWIGQVITKYGP